jgi:Cof subfamily protein (haloacid dehalogenase superfamily)
MYIFMDIDGTLLPSHCSEPPQKTILALDTALRRGHHLFLCTGRTREKSEPLFKYGFEGIIGSAGGYVESAGEVLFDMPMTKLQLDTATSTLAKDGILMTLECAEGMFSDGASIIRNRGTGCFNLPEDRAMLNEIRWNVSHFDIRPMSEYSGQPVYKILLLYKEPCRPDASVSALGSEFDFRLQEKSTNGWHTGELINTHFSKGYGIRLIMERLGISASDTIGFGDGENDLEMAMTAGRFVAVSGAPQSLTDLADYVCPDPVEGGIYTAFQKMNLI